jgi:hypothetical protein
LAGISSVRVYDSRSFSIFTGPGRGLDDRFGDVSVVPDTGFASPLKATLTMLPMASLAGANVTVICAVLTYGAIGLTQVQIELPGTLRAGNPLSLQVTGWGVLRSQVDNRDGPLVQFEPAGCGGAECPGGRAVPGTAFSRLRRGLAGGHVRGYAGGRLPR